MKREIKRKSIIGALILLTGLLMVIASLGAPFLGIDRDAGWGPARVLLLVSGIAFLIAPYLLSIMRAIRSGLLRLVPPSWQCRWQESVFIPQLNRKFERMITSSRSIDSAQRKKKIDVYLFLVFLLSLLVLTWIISVGRWVEWPETTNYFHLQARAFLSGQLHLLTQPSEPLLQLSDPYTFENREHIPYLWDASLYDGKYHLYWGPIPAVVTALLESVLGVEVGDQHLVYLFTIGAISFGLLILRLIWNDFFPSLAAWTILPGAIVVCLGNPGPWLLGRPAVYEAAIASGQFFLMGGVFWFLRGSGSRPFRISHIGLSGVFVASALAARISLLPGALILSLVGLARIVCDDIGQGSPLRLFIRTYAVYYGLIILGIILLGWYNHARFGDMFEFGHRYQLTSWGMASTYKDFFSLRNLLPNFYNYLLTGYRPIPVFPFIKPVWGVAGVPALKASAVANYHAEQITGILTTTPIIVVGCFPIYHAIRAFWARLDNPDFNFRASVALLMEGEGHLIYLGIFVLSIGLVLPLGLISYSSMRYIYDFSLSASIFSAIGFGLALRSETSSGVTKASIAFMAGLLSLYSSIVGVLLGITSYAARFEHLNPELFDQITRFFAF